MVPKNQLHVTSLKAWFYLVMCGICMGTADIVPGISGGTIAFIMGFYVNLLDSLKSIKISSLFKLQFKEFYQQGAWGYLSAILSGIVLSFILLSHFFNFILGHEVYRVFLYSLFFGLIIGSAFFCVKRISKWQWSHFFIFFVGGALAFALTGTDLQSLSRQEPLFDVEISSTWANIPLDKKIQNYDAVNQMLRNVPKSTLSAMFAKGAILSTTKVLSHDAHSYGTVQQFVYPEIPYGIDWWIICCGIIASGAMLLPGISGSYLLSILGMYSVSVGALADFLGGIKNFAFDTEAFMIIVNMLLGIVIGLLGFTRLISWLLKTYHDAAIVLLTGFMIGALRSVWPFWSYAYHLNPLKIEKGPQLQVVDPVLPSSTSFLLGEALLLTIFGFLLIIGIERLVSRAIKSA